jgi:HK97 family phage major capsid protein/HK97 family phage prohead protease
MPDNRQRIFSKAILRAAGSEEAMVVEGYALKFGQWTSIGSGRWGFDEQIARGAMSSADLSDVVLNFNHNLSDILARTTAKTLELEADDTGLKIRAELVDTQASRDVYELIRTGHITQMSFAVEIKESVWEIDEEGEERDKRTITAFGRFYDVSAVTFPAYEDTQIEASSEEMAALRAERDAALTERKREMTATIAPVEEIEDRGEVVPAEVSDDTGSATESVDERGERVVVENHIHLDAEVEPTELRDANQPPALAETLADVNESDDSVYDTTGYRNAWLESIRRDDRGACVRRFLATNGEEGEGVLVPTQIVNAIEHEVRRGGSIAALCKHLTVKALLSLPLELSADDAAWHTEGSAAPAEEEVTFGDISLLPKMIKKWIEVTDEMETMAIDAFADYLIGEIADKILTALDAAIISGTPGATGTGGDGKGCIGIVGNEHTAEVALEDIDWQTGDFAVGEVEEVVEGSIVAVMNRKTFYQKLLQIKDTTGQPIAKVITDANGKALRLWDGIPVRFSKALKPWSLAGDGDPVAVIGDFSGYTLNFPNGYAVSIIRNPYIKDIEDRVRYTGKLFAAGNVTRLESFVVVTKVVDPGGEG